VAPAAPSRAQDPILRWGGDAEGGAPFMEANPEDPTKLVGFDVEIAELIAAELGRTPQFVQVAFAQLDQSAIRGDFDIGLCGIEDTPARRSMVAASVPYYEFREVITVREADRDRFKTLADLRGRRVATLGGTIAYEILLKAETELGLTAVSYDDDVHPYEDLLLGRVDAVLLDNVLADRSMRRNTGLFTQEEAVEAGHYVVITGPSNLELRDRVDDILRSAMADGRLEAIFRKWNVWNDDQPELYARVLAASSDVVPGAPASGHAPRPSRLELTFQYLPSLFEAALVTLLLSCLAMATAAESPGRCSPGTWSSCAGHRCCSSSSSSITALRR
jgi:polar amino acid transport system substrate-binding protein